MIIESKCPHCDVLLKVGNGHAGKNGTCPSCKKGVTIPAENEVPKDTSEVANKE